MSNISIFNDLLEVYNALDTIDDQETKLETITTWIRSLQGISQAKICNFSETDNNHNNSHNFAEPNTNVKTNYIRNLISRKPGIIYSNDNELNNFLNASSWTGKMLCYPVLAKNEKLLGAILLKGEDELQLFRDYNIVLQYLCSKLKEIFETEFLKDKLQKENDFLNLFISQQNVGVNKLITTQNSHLINWINLPLYIADIDGNILYANNVLLKLLKVNELSELQNEHILFPQSDQRKKEIEKILLNGRIDNYRLSIKRKDGFALEVLDSALLMGAHIFGFFFDVTELIRLNRDITDALKMQEFLNDKLISSSLLLQRTQATTIRSLARLAEYRDGETGEHLDRICEYSAVLSQEVYKKQPYNWRISEKYISDLIVSSMLHDIGKVGVPDGILLKPGKLNREEFERMKNHTIWGWAILNQADMELGEQSYLTLAASIALHHHEHYNGNGYPHQLVNEKIPLSARIEAIADVYDALTSSRPYKIAWSHEQAIEEIKNQSGKQFDPVLVEIFLSVEDKIYNIRNKLAK